MCVFLREGSSRRIVDAWEQTAELVSGADAGAPGTPRQGTMPPLYPPLRVIGGFLNSELWGMASSECEGTVSVHKGSGATGQPRVQDGVRGQRER